jgi:hypothetical protein
MAKIQADLRHATNDDPVPPGAPAGSTTPLYWQAQAVDLSNAMRDSPLPACPGAQ